jgi:hypothetical protein
MIDAQKVTFHRKSLSKSTNYKKVQQLYFTIKPIARVSQSCEPKARQPQAMKQS